MTSSLQRKRTASQRYCPDPVQIGIALLTLSILPIKEADQIWAQFQKQIRRISFLYIVAQPSLYILRTLPKNARPLPLVIQDLMLT